MLSYVHFLCWFGNKSIPVRFANEVWKEPITQFEDKLPEHSNQDGPKTMECQFVLSDVMCKSFHITVYINNSVKQWFIHNAMSKCFLWEHHCVLYACICVYKYIWATFHWLLTLLIFPIRCCRTGGILMIGRWFGNFGARWETDCHVVSDSENVCEDAMMCFCCFHLFVAVSNSASFCACSYRKPFTHKMHRSTWWSQAISWWCRTSSTFRGSSGSTWFWMRPRHWKAARGKALSWRLFHCTCRGFPLTEHTEVFARFCPTLEGEHSP